MLPPEDETRFGLLYARLCPDVLGMVRAKTHNVEMREDLRQSAWVAVAQTVSTWSVAFYWSIGQFARIVYRAIDAAYHCEWRYWEHKRMWLALADAEGRALLLEDGQATTEDEKRDESALS